MLGDLYNEDFSICAEYLHNMGAVMTKLHKGGATVQICNTNVVKEDEFRNITSIKPTDEMHKKNSKGRKLV